MRNIKIPTNILAHKLNHISNIFESIVGYKRGYTELAAFATINTNKSTKIETEIAFLQWLLYMQMLCNKIGNPSSCFTQSTGLIFYVLANFIGIDLFIICIVISQVGISMLSIHYFK